MLSWVRGLSTGNVADAFGYECGRPGFPRRLDETEDCGGCRGWHRRSRALQPAVGDERRRGPRPAPRAQAPLSVEGMGPILLGGRGGRALGPRARHLRGGVLPGISEEFPGAFQELQGVRPGSPGMWRVREADRRYGPEDVTSQVEDFVREK